MRYSTDPIRMFKATYTEPRGGTALHFRVLGAAIAILSALVLTPGEASIKGTAILKGTPSSRSSS